MDEFARSCACEGEKAVAAGCVSSLQLEAFEKNRQDAALGPPGTGKTLVVNRCVRRWQARGAQVLFALPTGQLAAETSRSHPEIDVDTCHGAFLFYKEISQALPLLSGYDLIVVDEVSMLTAEHFDRLVAMWHAAGRLPCLDGQSGVAQCDGDQLLCGLPLRGPKAAAQAQRPADECSERQGAWEGLIAHLRRAVGAPQDGLQDNHGHLHAQGRAAAQ